MSPKTAMRVVLVITLLVPVRLSELGDPLMDLLKDKIFDLELDMKVLRADMNKMSEEISRLPNLLKDMLTSNSPIPGNNKQPPVNPQDTSDVKRDLQQFKLRMRRAFTEEKVQARLLMKELRSEIAGFGTTNENFHKKLWSEITTFGAKVSNNHNEVKSEVAKFGVEMVKVLDDLEKSQAKSLSELSDTFVEYKTVTLAELKEGQTAVQTSLASFINESLVQEFGSRIKTSTDTMTSGLRSLVLVHEQQTSAINSSVALTITNAIGSQIKILEKHEIFLRELHPQLLRIYSKVIKVDDIADTIDNTFTHTRDDRDVRLRNVMRTTSYIGGRLEVLYGGEWGTVCDDNFAMPSAKVACSMLGFPSAYSFKGYSYFGKGAGETHMDNVKCTGQESSLFNCDRIGAGSSGYNDCDHTEDVGVICKID